VTPASSVAGLCVGVTGVGGFLGRHVEAALRADGGLVTPLHGDVREPLAASGPLDVVCHLAGWFGPRFAANPMEGLAVNVTGTLHALELCRRLGARLVLASTCAVYRPIAGAVPEGAVRRPPNGYGFSKLLAETLAETYARAVGVPVTILRLFNPYGPGQSPAFVIPYLCGAIAEGRPVRLQHPDSMRDFVHARDVADAVRRACLLSDRAAVNVGSGRPRRVREVAETIARLAGRPLQLDSVPADAGDDPFARMWADAGRAAAVLGWAPSVSLEVGLEEALEAAAVRR
jgi:nucleoside-diphosphate-sugar epimerase